MVLSKTAHSFRQIIQGSGTHGQESSVRIFDKGTVGYSETPVMAVGAWHPPAFSTRWVVVGYFDSRFCGRQGRATSSPPQFGQVCCNADSAQRRQNVHSNEQIRASGEFGGRSRSQHSQFGLSSSTGGPFQDLPLRREWNRFKPFGTLGGAIPTRQLLLPAGSPPGADTYLPITGINSMLLWVAPNQISGATVFKIS